MENYSLLAGRIENEVSHLSLIVTIFTMGGARNWCGIERGFFKLETTSREREN
jgi:hypothetical protein